jgi:UDP-N-acetylglucosamine 2-epimerase (non-hydrolysing)
MGGMSELRILVVIGCPPNFIKIAPLLAEMKKYPEIHSILVHTGQHYTHLMSDVFFRDLNLPRPDVCLDVGSGSYARQIALMIHGLEGVLLDINPDLVLAIGDVNSAVAACLTAIPLGFPVAHLDAGLRSFNRELPEEINRVLTDSISDILFTTERSAVKNLLCEGRPRQRIYFVGNTIIDSLVMNADKIAQSDILNRLRLSPRRYAVITLDQPANVDDGATLGRIINAVTELQRHIQLVFPLHPRTFTRLERFGYWQQLISLPQIRIVDPLAYLDLIKLMKESLFVLTDSGGVQEETTALGVPCLTLRQSTEHVATVAHGTNQLVGSDHQSIVGKGVDAIHGVIFRGGMPEKWDGLASKRIVSLLLKETDTIKQLYGAVRQRGICLDLLSRT